MFEDDQKIWEMTKRQGFTLSISGRRELQKAIRRRWNRIWLELNPEQYEALRRPALTRIPLATE
jgi:hypothetical protein